MNHSMADDIGASIGEALASDMPAPDIDSGPSDRMGRKFDPELHSANPDGSPRLTKNGNLRSRKGTLTQSNDTSGPDQYQVAGTVAGETDAMIMGMLLAWQPSVESRGALCVAWSEYFRIKGITNIPPELLIIGAHAQILNEALRPKDSPARERLANFAFKVKSFFGRWKRGKNAYPDNRDYRMRQDNVSHIYGERVHEAQSESDSSRPAD